jgi:hypothetical protein
LCIFAGASLNTDIGPGSEAPLPDSHDDEHEEKSHPDNANFTHEDEKSGEAIKNGKHENGKGKSDTKANTNV